MTRRRPRSGDEAQLALDFDDAVHPWVAKARTIDAASGGSSLDAETLARFVRIVRAATGGARPADSGRRSSGLAGREARRRAG